MRICISMAILAILVSVSITQGWCQDTKPKAVPSPKEPTNNSSEIPRITELKPMSFWMARKLEYSKALIESLTKADYEKLAQDAEQMQLIGKLEGFVRRKNEHYRQQLRTFEFANQELIRQSKRKSSEGATLAFNQLTSSCVACHVLLREGVD